MEADLGIRKHEKFERCKKREIEALKRKNKGFKRSSIVSRMEKFVLIRLLARKCSACDRHKGIWNDNHYQDKLSKFDLTIRLVEIEQFSYPVGRGELQQLNRRAVGDPTMTNQNYIDTVPCYVLTSREYYEKLSNNPGLEPDPKLFIKFRKVPPAGGSFNNPDYFVKWVGDTIAELNRNMSYQSAHPAAPISSSSSRDPPPSIQPVQQPASSGNDVCGKIRIVNLRGQF